MRSSFAERRVELSIVVPVYGCSAALRSLHAGLTRVLPGLVDRYEIILVDDRAHDDSWRILHDLAHSDAHVIACRLSRNFGQQIAITAGLEQARGDYIVVMDCDLQDPPEVIPELLAAARRGADIVFAKRKAVYTSGARTILGRRYFRLLSLLAGLKIDPELGAFSLISRRVAEAFLRFGERDRQYLLILYWLGFETSTIEYDRAPREIGQSSYTLRKLIAHGLSGIFFTTTRLLNWVVYLGFTLAGSSALLAFYFVAQWFFYGSLPGWTSLIVVQLFVGGMITICIGVVALYIGKIFEASQKRPLYFVQDRIDGQQEVESRSRRTGVS
jgi:polyisoprenyl-phosphate glycosyltransferase